MGWSCSIVAVPLLLMPPLIVSGGKVERSEALTVLELRDVPLVFALQELASMEDCQIAVKGDIEGYLISVTLEQGEMQQNLKRILKGLNYALEKGLDNQLTLWVFPAGVEAKVGALPVKENRPPPGSKATPAVLPGSAEVIPPDVEGGSGVSGADIAYFKSRQLPVDPANLEVIPADEGRRSVTQAEIQRIIESRRPIAVSPPEVLPPDKPGERGISLLEVEGARQANARRVAPALVDIVPPD